MVLRLKDNNISSLEDIQKLEMKDLPEVLRSHFESTGGKKADFVLKVFALLMRRVLASTNIGKNRKLIPLSQKSVFVSRLGLHCCCRQCDSPNAFR